MVVVGSPHDTFHSCLSETRLPYCSQHLLRVNVYTHLQLHLRLVYPLLRRRSPDQTLFITRRTQLVAALGHIVTVGKPLGTSTFLIYVFDPDRRHRFTTVARSATRLERRHNAFHRSSLQHQWSQQQSEQRLCCYRCLSFSPLTTAYGRRQ